MRQMTIRRTNAGNGFTLVELLVVIAIIAILVSLTLAAGTKVVSVGRERGTQWALQALDNSVSEYIQSSGGIPSATVKDPLDTSANPRRVPIVDGLVDDQSAAVKGYRMMDSTAWYLHQLEAEGSSALAAVNQIDPRLRTTGIVTTGSGISDSASTGSRTTRIVDVWGNPIRYVHPRFAGTHTGTTAGSFEDVTDVLGNTGTYTYKFTKIFRDGKERWKPDPDNAGDWLRITLDTEKNMASARGASDGGATQNRRPYFYSAGPDGDPSTIEDNVYTIRPEFPK
ncbi:MAG: type II secretion system protein [Planctomycetes bacterium]|nr:type II secretion system protein [Planctomycetota bacterium]